MRKYLPILMLMLLMLSLISIDCRAVVEASSNPTEFTSLTSFYSEVPKNPDGTLPEYYSLTIDNYGYIGQFRVFVPPGTAALDLSIKESGKQKVVARHMVPPKGSPDDPPTGYVPGNNYTLSELIKSDCWVTEDSFYELAIATGGFSPPIEANRAGWLYAKVGGGDYSQYYANRFTARVKSDVYNAWWYANIKDKSVWDKYVEGVETYTDPPEPNTQPVLFVSPIIQSVPLTAGTTTFNVSNEGTGTTMSWVPVVIEGTDWLTVTSFTSGNSGTLACSYTAYAAGSGTRTGKIRIVSNGATNSPVEVTVTQNGATAPVLTVTPTNQMVPLSAGTTTFNVSNSGIGTMPWTAAVIDGSDWLKITEGATGTDSGTITCSYGTVNSTRTGKIQITANGATGSPAVVTVTQSSTVVPILTVTPSSQLVNLSAGTTTFNVSNSGIGTMPWTAAVIDGSDWLKITEGATGTDSGTITCSYGTVNSTRTGKIQITANGATGNPAVVTVTQGGVVVPVLTVTPSNQSVPLSAGTTTFTVSNTGVGTMPWTAAVISVGEWLKITSDPSGTNNGTITCSYDATKVTRTGEIKISADSAPNAPVYVTVTQDGTEPSVLSVTPKNLTVLLSGGTTTFSISNTGKGTMPWTAAVMPGSEWVTISPSSGTDNGTITCSISATTSMRTGTIRITASGATGSPADVTLTQSGTMVTMPVPATGQTTCYDGYGNPINPCPTSGQAFYGQDANYKINPMSYTKLDSSGNVLPDVATSWVMVRDNVTGLIWEAKTNKDWKQNLLDPHDADNKYTWYDNNPETNGGYAGNNGNNTDTEAFIKKLNLDKFGGYDDWRLPTINELENMVSYNVPDKPLIDSDFFPNTQNDDKYWSSSNYNCNDQNEKNKAWAMDFSLGYGNFDIKDIGHYVIAVRSENYATNISGRFVDNQDRTITDNMTGLMWQQDPAKMMNWQSALSYCDDLNKDIKLGNHTDWRLPSIKELKSIADYSLTSPPAINTVFAATEPNHYWSATTNVFSKIYSYAWFVDYVDGSSFPSDKIKELNYVRAVRDMSMLSVTPSSSSVSKDIGAVSLNVFVSGQQAVTWKAEQKIVGTPWLTIETTNNNSNHGIIKCTYSANPSAETRTATIQITATGTELLNSPMDVTISQAPNCIATLNNSSVLNIPYINYASGNLILWADFNQEENSQEQKTYFKLIENQLDTITNPSSTCSNAAIMSSDLNIHVPYLLMPNGSSMCMDMKYRPDKTPGVYFEAISGCTN